MKSILIFFMGFFLIACHFEKKTEHNTPQKFKDTEANMATTLKDYPIQESKDPITIIKVPEEFKLSERFMLDSLIDSIRYVPLETNKSSLIQYIEKVIPFEGSLFVLDMRSKVVLKFDANGKFVMQIGKNGKGPGEYITPTSFEIINKQIIVWDDRSSKIIYYDTDGTFLMDKKLGFRMNHFIAFGKDKYICEIVARKNFHVQNINNYKLIFCQSDWQIIGRADKYNADIEDGLSISRNTITQYGDQLVYNPSFEYFIYNIDETGIYKKYFVDVGTHKLPVGYNQNISINSFVKKYMSSESDCMIIFQNVYETNNHLVGSFDYKKQKIPFYYSKKSGKLICNKFYNYSPKFPFGLVHQKNISGNTFIGSIDPSLILSSRDRWIEHPDDMAMAQIPKDVRDLANNIKVNDNPVLVFYTLKDF